MLWRGKKDVLKMKIMFDIEGRSGGWCCLGQR